MTFGALDPRPAVPDRPLLAFRVGITGRRKLPAEHEAKLRARVADVLRLVREEVACLARDSAVLEVYRREAGWGRAASPAVSLAARRGC
jgi:hypothetical protein